MEDILYNNFLKTDNLLDISNKITLGFSSLYYSILPLLPDEFSKFRVNYYNKNGCKIHKITSISPNVQIKGRFEMGCGSSIAQNCSISCESAGVFIGENVMIAPNLVIVVFNHKFDRVEEPMVFQKNNEETVIIEDDLWISFNCTVAKGVRIGKGSIVGANSFVNKNIPPFSIVGGVPARIIKSRI